MKIELTERQQAFRAAARQFAERELAPVAAALDRDQTFPSGILRAAAAAGLCGICVNERDGGAGLDTVAFAAAIEEISRHCASTGLVLAAHNALVCDTISERGTEDQRKRFLPDLSSGRTIGAYAWVEPSGSSPEAFRTTARREGDGYVLDGEKVYVTGALGAGLFLVWASTDPSRGARGLTAFLVEGGTRGLSIRPEPEKMGVRAAGTASLVFDQCRVPASRRLGEEGEGLEMAQRALDGGRIGIAAQSVGIARAALEEALRYAQARKAGEKPIAALQAIQFQIADMATEVDAARLLTWKAAWARDRVRSGSGGDSWTLEASTAKLFASEAANKCAYRALQIHGGYGYTKDCPVERHFRDARITEIDQGTSEIQRIAIASRILQDAG